MSRHGSSPALSSQTASFLLWLVNQQQPNAGAPDFREAVARIVRAQDELQAIVEAQAEPVSEQLP
jgi:hypothetical protein